MLTEEDGMDIRIPSTLNGRIGKEIINRCHAIWYIPPDQVDVVRLFGSPALITQYEDTKWILKVE